MENEGKGQSAQKASCLQVRDYYLSLHFTDLTQTHMTASQCRKSYKCLAEGRRTQTVEV